MDKLTVGKILYSRWGYDQTNIDFYEVIKVTPKMATVQAIGQRATRTDEYGMIERVVPNQNDRKGKTYTRKIVQDKYNNEEFVRISNYENARPWDGRSKTQTHTN